MSNHGQIIERIIGRTTPVLVVEGVEAVDYYGPLHGSGYDSSCANRCIISEAALSRLLSMVENSDWAIISAYRKEFTLPQNIQRNRDLRSSLNAMKAGVYQLVGHWKECQLKGEDGKPIPYNQCPAEQLKDTVERSYLCVRPKDMDRDAFFKRIQELMTIGGETQDAVLIHKAGDLPHGVKADRSGIETSGEVFVLQNDGESFPIGKQATLGKVAQAYSQHVRKLNVPFVFEGVETPGSNMGSLLFQRAGLPRLFIGSDKDWHIGI